MTLRRNKQKKNRTEKRVRKKGNIRKKEEDEKKETFINMIYVCVCVAYVLRIFKILKNYVLCYFLCFIYVA